jgi:beta-lactamase superfamily II metal-dependent hydrolase
MKLDIFQSDKGDCILLESKDSKRILCDGGMSRSMNEHVAPTLGKLRKANKNIDFAYVSHIDQDHISGVLRLLQDELDWRVFEHQKSSGNKKVKPPKAARPPKIGGIWHNSFGSQLAKKLKPVEDLLAAAVPALLATGVKELRDAGEEFYDIATSIPDAIKVSRLASPHILGIPLNEPPGLANAGKLMMVRPGQSSFNVGSLNLTIVGPTQKELTELRKGWRNWLAENEETVKAIDEQLKKKISKFGTAAAGEPISLRDWNRIPDFRGVTAPNIASLMFMVQEDNKTLLLTGDSQQDIIIDGLQATGFLQAGALHLDVLKVPHHGSENNTDIRSAALISADHYVFCGNGEHENPDFGVVEILIKSRLDSDPKRQAKAPQAAGRPFKFWFSSSSKLGPVNVKGEDHMREVEKIVAAAVKKSKGRMKATFNDGDFLTLKP